MLDGIRHDVEQELRAEMKTEMLSIQRKRELLAKIATGETYAVQNYKGKDCNMCVQHVWSTINQMLKAIDLDNKMVGLYTSLQSPHKAQSATTINAQVAEQVDKFLQSMGLTIDNQENVSLEQEASTPAPEKSVEMATKDNKNPIEPENSSLEGGVTDAIGDGDACPPQAGPLAKEEDTEYQQSTTFISPTGLIKIRTNKDHDGESGTA